MFKFKEGDVIRFRRDWKKICDNGGLSRFKDWALRCEMGGRKRHATIEKVKNGRAIRPYRIKWNGSEHTNKVYEEMLELVEEADATKVYDVLDRIMKDAAERSEV